MNNILKYTLLFFTNLIFDTNENLIKNNHNDTAELINNLQSEIDKIKEPELFKSKIIFYTLETISIVGNSIILISNVSLTINISTLCLLCGSIYCTFFDFSNYTYIPLLAAAIIDGFNGNSFNIFPLINYYQTTSKVICITKKLNSKN